MPRTPSGRSCSRPRTTGSGSRRSRPRGRARSAAGASPGSRRCAGRRLIEGKSVAVVIPAYQEEELLPAVLGGVPEFVDRIYVVDDASQDGTVGRARAAANGDRRISVIPRDQNGGVGAAGVTGYRQAGDDRMGGTVVVNAGNQMDPEDLAHLATPGAKGEGDYPKGDRRFTGQA